MLFAIVALIVLLVLGLYLGELRFAHVVFCVSVAIGGVYVFDRLKLPFASYPAVLAAIDVILVLVIFKGDIRIR